MLYAILFMLGLAAGAVSVFLYFREQQKKVAQQKNALDSKEKSIKEAVSELRSRRQEMDEKETAAKALQEKMIETTTQMLATQREEMDRMEDAIKTRKQEIERQIISYKDLQEENNILKHDLQNIDVNLRKLQLDRDLQRQNQETLDARVKELGKRFLKDNIKWLGSSLTPNNYAASKQRLLDVVERCRGIGFEISPVEETGYLEDLKAEYERIVRAAFEREEQARIKAQIREEQLREREIEQELKRLDRERAAIQAALDKALADAKDKYSEEVERLKARLAEAEEKKRAVSQAQLTKSGHVYVISNIGSFGDGVYKIGMTRRLEPEMRVRELSSASVPFPYDVHMMISCNDAPALENDLHRTFHKMRLNKANPRKEFFKTDIEAIRKIVEANHGEVQYVVDPEALEYRQSLTMTDEDSQFIESVFDAVEDQSEFSPDN